MSFLPGLKNLIMAYSYDGILFIEYKGGGFMIFQNGTTLQLILLKEKKKCRTVL